MSPAYPLRLEGRLDPRTSRLLWILKWLLVLPQAVVMVFLCLCSGLTWIVVFVAILITGRYPAGLFRYNVGVMRWSWRLSFYSSGAFATDEYPPFTLDDTDYPARLEVTYPEHLDRGLVLVKWLLAVPHLLIVWILVDVTVTTGGGVGHLSSTQQDSWVSWDGWGLIPILALGTAVVFAVTGRYPQGMFDLLMGLNRWVYRVWAYLMLMTDEYPPFRLDRGGEDPATAPVPPGAAKGHPNASDVLG
jgi:hypothetical protein